MKSLVWFRSDLRVRDNQALWNATRAKKEIVALYIKSPKQWEVHDWSPAKTNFTLGCLKELSSSLAAKGIRLYIEECPMFKQQPKLVAEFAKSNDCSNVFWNAEYEVNESARDLRVTETLTKANIPFEESHDQVIVHPTRILNGDGKPYTVFSAYQRAWFKVVGPQHLMPLNAPRSTGEVQAPRMETPDEVPNFPPGEEEAIRRLKSFIKDGAERYDKDRDRVDIDSTSKLSAYLAAGAISNRTCIYAASRVDGRGAKKWMSELIWREFYRYVVYHFPRVCKHRSFRLETEHIRWHESDHDFKKWQDGLTGFPIVDAGMRQLKAESFLPNRMRMIVAMFLVKDLLIDWRRGEKHFMRHLVDGDLASNNGGWQWCASTGNDAAPYFRIMNPELQSKKCDPHGDYIRRWVPELADIEGDAIHNPSSFDREACGYPQPIVDHSQARLRTIAAYKRALA